MELVCPLPQGPMRREHSQHDSDGQEDREWDDLLPGPSESHPADSSLLKWRDRSDQASFQ
jgi:hypothetical protein